MPAPTKPISREYRIYLALWRKAYLQPTNPVSIKTSSFTMAVAMRQGMYRAIRPFRSGEMVDGELQKAAEKYVVYLVKADDKNNPHFLELRERKTLSELESDWDALGIDEEDLLLGDERNIHEKLRHLIEDEATPAARATPFYERDA
jgi:hypothetical protein